MSCSGRKAWSTAGSLRGTYHYGGDPRKISRNLSLPYHGSSPGIFNAHGGKKLQRTAQDSFDGFFRLGSINPGYNLNNPFGSPNGWKNEGYKDIIHMSSKETMKLLNDRLAKYLEQVSKLEEENNQLETNIQAWHEKNAQKEQPNFNHYFKIVEELKSKILNTALENSQAVLHIDNARLAVDDLLYKYKLELNMRNNIEADIQALRKGLDRLTLEKCDLEFQVGFLTEDLASLKKSHNEEIDSLKTQLGARVNVEVDAAPSVDLNETLLGIRNEYEGLMEQNMKDMENWFMTQSEELNSQMITETEELRMVKTEVIELRHMIQTLEINLQTELSKKLALEGTLAETTDDYVSRIAYIQELVNNVEAELAKLRCDLERQYHEYKILMDVRTRLEMEIATYQRLLQEENIIAQPRFTKRKGLKAVLIIEDFEDGKFVSKQEQIHHI